MNWDNDWDSLSRKLDITKGECRFKPFAYFCENCQRTHYLNRMKEVCPKIQREMET